MAQSMSVTTTNEASVKSIPSTKIGISNRYVEMSVKFLKVGRIDTKAERFDAALLIESTWEDLGLINEIRSLIDYKNLPSNRFDEIRAIVKAAETYDFNTVNNWTPNLVISNAFGELKEEISYQIEIINGSNKKKSSESEVEILDQLENLCKNLKARVTEKRIVKGTYYQKLDLKEFPIGKYFS